MPGLDLFGVLIALTATALLVWLSEKLTGRSWWSNKPLSQGEPIKARYWRFRAKTFGCLNSGRITLTVWDEAKPQDTRRVELPAQLIPFEMRMPNSEFDLLFDHQERRFAQVLPIGEPHPDTE